MNKDPKGLDRRKFVKTGLQVAGAAALAGGAKPGAASVAPALLACMVNAMAKAMTLAENWERWVM